MSNNYREIIVDVEPRQKEFKVAVMRDTTVEEVINTLVRRCQDEGISVQEWSRSKVGQSNVSFVLMRKATGNTAIAPTMMFQELFPELEDRETFKLDARAQVGSFEDPVDNRSDKLIVQIPDEIRFRKSIETIRKKCLHGDPSTFRGVIDKLIIEDPSGAIVLPGTYILDCDRQEFIKFCQIVSATGNDLDIGFELCIIGFTDCWIVRIYDNTVKVAMMSRNYNGTMTPTIYTSYIDIVREIYES